MLTIQSSTPVATGPNGQADTCKCSFFLSTARKRERVRAQLMPTRRLYEDCLAFSTASLASPVPMKLPDEMAAAGSRDQRCARVEDCAAATLTLMHARPSWHSPDQEPSGCSSWLQLSETRSEYGHNKRTLAGTCYLCSQRHSPESLSSCSFTTSAALAATFESDFEAIAIGLTTSRERYDACVHSSYDMHWYTRGSLCAVH